MHLKKKSAEPVVAPTGTYEGYVPLVIDILFTFASATSANMDINVKVANREIKCPAEAIAVSTMAGYDVSCFAAWRASIVPLRAACNLRMIAKPGSARPAR